MDAELERWAAARAPDLLERAEQRAVELLARALVDAALAHRSPTLPVEATRQTSRTDAPRQERVSKSVQTGHGLWAYCVAAAGIAAPSGLTAVHPEAPVERIEHEGLAALVSRVPLAEFGEQALRENLNDLVWLERVARAHEGVLEATLESTTIVPLRLCTIYRDQRSVKDMLERERHSLEAALERLRGHQEWSVKLLVDRPALETAARERSDEAEALERELAGSGGGGAYMLRRRLERQLRHEADRLLEELAEDVHARLQDWAGDAVLNPPQNRELSGHEGEMALNAAYLVATEKVPRLRELVAELGERHKQLGARLELTGPWPPYNFVPS